ncbi:MAG: hypothetical protein AAGC84_07440 [Pseudomonas sp.]
MGKKNNRRAALIEQYTAEAERLGGGFAEEARRIFQICAAVGRELEPSGPMAGKIPEASSPDKRRPRSL